MAVPQPTVVVPGPSEVGSYIYVVQFSSGTIKVGQTKDPTSRLRTHEAGARIHGVTVTDQWVSQPVAEPRRLERSVIEFCKSQYSSINGGEYFAGAEASEIIGFVETLEDGTSGSIRMAQVAWPPRPVSPPSDSGSPSVRPVGRPAVGRKCEFRVTWDTLATVDGRAAKEGVARAEMLRRLIEAGLR